MHPQRPRRAAVRLPRLVALGGLVLGLALGAAGAVSAATTAAPADELATADKVRAAYLYNFTKFARWPAAAFANASSPILLCSWAGPAFDGFLGALVLDRVGQDGRSLQVVSAPQQRAGCHLVYAPASATSTAPAVDAGTCTCLVVGEPASGDPDQTLTFQLRKRRLRFSVNHAALERSSVGLSAELLALAVTTAAPPALRAGLDATP